MIAAIGALGASAFQSVGGFGGITGGISRLFGGGDSEPPRQRYGECPGQPTAEVTYFLQHASESDFRRLKTEWDKINWDDRSPQARYQSNLTRNADPFIVAQGIAGGDDCRVGTSASVQRLMTTASSLGLVQGGIVMAPAGPSPSSRLGDAIGQIGSNIGQVLTNTVEGALGGATAASGAAAQGSSISLTNPFVMLAIGAAAILLLRK